MDCCDEVYETWRVGLRGGSRVGPNGRMRRDRKSCKRRPDNCESLQSNQEIGIEGMDN